MDYLGLRLDWCCEFKVVLVFGVFLVLFLDCGLTQRVFFSFFC